MVRNEDQIKDKEKNASDIILGESEGKTFSFFTCFRLSNCSSLAPSLRTFVIFFSLCKLMEDQNVVLETSDQIRNFSDPVSWFSVN